jgi:hypothetical protein
VEPKGTATATAVWFNYEQVSSVTISTRIWHACVGRWNLVKFRGKNAGLTGLTVRQGVINWLHRLDCCVLVRRGHSFEWKFLRNLMPPNCSMVWMEYFCLMNGRRWQFEWQKMCISLCTCLFFHRFKQKFSVHSGNVEKLPWRQQGKCRRLYQDQFFFLSSLVWSLLTHWLYLRIFWWCLERRDRQDRAGNGREKACVSLHL